MGEESRYTCTSCKEKMPIGQLRYNNDMKLMCLKCYQESQSKKTATETRLRAPIEVAPSQKSAQSVQPAKPAQNVIAFICQKCKYKFKFKETGLRSPRCPYCGNEDTRNLMDKVPSAEELIREASNARYG